MGLFGERKRDTPRRGGRVLHASGQRIDLRSEAALTALRETRRASSWQSDAWGYRDMIGELRFAHQFLARAVARVRFFPAEIIPTEDDPIPVNHPDSTLPPGLAQAAREELSRLPLGAGYQFVGILSENLDATGEAYLHGWFNEDEDREDWEVLSVDEVLPGDGGGFAIRRFGATAPELVDPDTEEMLRLWVPHPRYKNLADSPMRALLDVCEDIVLAGREIRAASRSRIATNGILKIPNGLSLLRSHRDDEERSDTDTNPFMADLVASILAPIQNEGDPGAVAPIGVQGELEDLAGFQHMTIERAVAEDLLERVDRWLTRLARGLDIPPEILSGIGDTNHWSAWQIDASTYRYHIDPRVRIVADSITQGFLRPALRARGFSAADVARVCTWRDAGNLTENPNRGQDAKDAFDRGGIGWKTLRTALGFNDTDAPDDDELVKILAVRIGVDPATAALMLQAALGNTMPAAPVRPVVAERVDRPAVGPGQVPPDDGTPATGPPGRASALVQALVAAARQSDTAEPDAPDPDGWAVDDTAGRELMELDRVLRERLLAAADAAVRRAVEVASSRLRSRAQRDGVLRERLRGVALDDIGRTVTRAGALALGADESSLLEGALERLQADFARWTAAAVDRAVSVVLSLLRLDPDSDAGRATADRLRATMTARVPAAWARLSAGLRAVAERWLFDPTPGQEPGEPTDTIVPPALIRAAVADVGGNLTESGGHDDDGRPARQGTPLGGIGTGQDVHDTVRDAGGELLGFQWAYGITLPPDRFDPHYDLDGERFSGWLDPRLSTTGTKWEWVGAYFAPGDHRGCMCDYVLTWAVPERSAILQDRLSVDTPNMRDARTLAEMDDATGRTGTTAQETRDERDRIMALQRRFLEGSRG